MKGLPRTKVGFDLSGVYSKDFAKRGEPNQGRPRTGQARGVTRPGRRLPAHKLQMAAVGRAVEAQEKRKRGEAIKFHCSRCKSETNSGIARGSLCVNCWVSDELADDKQLYISTMVKMARRHDQGFDTRKLFAQQMRIHDRMVHRLAAVGVDEKKSAQFVEALLAKAKEKGGRIVLPRMGEILQRLGVKLEAESK